jgi:hypothetical protein
MCELARHGMGTIWARHGMCELARHGMGTIWARHGMYELAFMLSQANKVSAKIFVGSINCDKYDHLSDHQLLKEGMCDMEFAPYAIRSTQIFLQRRRMFACQHRTDLCVHCTLSPQGIRVFSAGRVCAGYW